jgi:NAD(P)-dependent dehydrogenase (short-subunit alcohol dehydrogenase family)
MASDGKVVIVTGGCGHLGRGVCRALTKAGFTVVAFDIDTSNADGAERAVTLDVTDADACAAAVDEVVRDFGGIDALVNMAQKIIIQTPLLELTDEHMRASFESGPMATLRMIQLCHPHMKARGGGSVVNFASQAGTWGNVGMGAYGAAKEAIRGITKCASLELGKDGIRVNTICPVAFADPTSSWAQRSLAENPLGRVGEPEADIGGAVVFLCGPVWINGRTIHVDGGTGSFR